MSDQQQNTSLAPLYALIAVVGAASGLIYLQKPLESARPTASMAFETKAPKEWKTAATPPGEVGARLWQDPLVAVQHHINTNDPPSADEIPSEFCYTLSEEERTVIISVAVPAGFGVEDHETRLRSRFSVLAALDFGGYWLSENGGLGFLTFRPKEKGAFDCSDPQRPREFRVPYEWATPNLLRSGPVDQQMESSEERTRFDKVLVLWIPETALSKKPLKRIGEIIGEFVQGQDVPVRFLGPISSDGYREIVAEIMSKKNSRDSAKPFDDFKILSSWATAADGLLELNPEPPYDRYEGFQRPDWFTRTIGSDEVLVAELIEELTQRGIDPTQDEIALISEWDSFYGRALPLSFAAHVNGEHSGDDLYWDLRTDESGFWPSNIIRVAYLQGLDGKIAGVEPLAVQARSKRTTEDRREGDVEALERPEGRSQLDYARRLAYELDRRSGRGLRAIGILGGDVYDKLLLIQALRSLFPHAIFFTTDLDARLSHPSQTRWTRNLVIASSFGLGLSEDESLNPAFAARQRQIPPFRDCYQTSLHVATLLALGSTLDVDALTQPKIYEVGRTQVHRLEPRPEQHRKTWPAIGAAVVFALLLILLMRNFRLSGEAWGSASLSATTLFVATLTIGWLWVANASGHHEPFAAADGISIWPTEILRLLAACLALYFFLSHRQLVRASDAELARTFCLPKADPKAKLPGATRWRRLLWVLRQSWSPGTDPVEVTPLWKEFMLRGSTPARCVRVGLLAVLYIAFGIALIGAGAKPVVPFRGDVARYADTLALVASVVLFILLVFRVIDTVLLDERFIRRLSAARSRWPASVCQGWADSSPARDFVQEWLDIRFISLRTEVVGRSVVGPFIVVFVLIICRLNIFDRWDWPPALVAIVTINSVYAIFAAVILRRTAERARRRSLARLRIDRLKCQATNDEPCIALIDRIIKDIKEVRKGAFAPVSQQPALRAILVPLGGLGTAALLELFLTSM